MSKQLMLVITADQFQENWECCLGCCGLGGPDTHCCVNGWVFIYKGPVTLSKLSETLWQCQINLLEMHNNA